MDYCSPSPTTCHPFTSTSAAAGQWFNFTETLGLNEYCVINVDATNFIAGVVVDDAVTAFARFVNNPGDTFNTTLSIGEELTIPQGNV